MNWDFWTYQLTSNVKQLGDINDEIKRMGKPDGGVRLDMIKNFVELQKATINNIEEALERLYELGGADGKVS